MRTGLILAALMLAAACSSPQEIQSARTAADQARASIDANDAAAFYQHTTPGYRAVTSAAQTAQMITAIHYALGACGPAGEPTNTTWNRSTNGYFITLTYARACDKGPLTETYVMSMDTNPPRLQGFNFNSPALLPAIAESAEHQPAQPDNDNGDSQQPANVDTAQ